MDHYMRTCMDKITKSSLKSFEMKMEHGIDGTDVAMNNIEQLCKIEQEFEVDNNLALSFNCEPSKDFDKEFKKQQVEARKQCQAPEDTQRYMKFMRDIEDVKASMNQAITKTTQQTQNTTNVDDMELQADMNTIDPITKRQIEDPVRNIICNHLYDLTSIRASLRMNPRLRCPYVGCLNKQPVTEANLQEDRELKQYLQAKEHESSMSLM